MGTLSSSGDIAPLPLTGRRRLVLNLVFGAVSVLMVLGGCLLIYLMKKWFGWPWSLVLDWINADPRPRLRALAGGLGLMILGPVLVVQGLRIAWDVGYDVHVNSKRMTGRLAREWEQADETIRATKDWLLDYVERTSRWDSVNQQLWVAARTRAARMRPSDPLLLRLHALDRDGVGARMYSSPGVSEWSRMDFLAGEWEAENLLSNIVGDAEKHWDRRDPALDAA